MGTQAGQLDRNVGLYHRVLTPNATGENVASWPTAYANVWAKKTDSVASRRGTKIIFADQNTLMQFTEFQIRYRTDVLASDRLVDENGLSYEILQMGEIGRHEYINLLCKAIQPA